MTINSYYLRSMQAAAAISSVLVIAGCSTVGIDPQNVGKGQFLQILQGTYVFTEIDTTNAGMLNCHSQAYQLIQKNSALAGRVKCSSSPSQDPLPYSFRAHRLSNVGDGYKPSSPYLVRTKTAQACASVRLATSKAERTIILSDDCAAVSIPPIKESIVIAPSPQPLPAPQSPISDRLRQLEQLRKDKLITEQEFKTRREAILNQL